ncbi:HAD family phosphatase [Mesorhizobium sp. M7A.F.Ca.US.006.01.1.1]|uniref:HAD family hydrolase n=1 Tax=Mesorhizobium sp. M7A.F.Ca.US.006.01.1.1 TaxID=2496707 RepID=UPI000FCC999C|nr:HAD family phosphatase [Mesorhizobium sp. M7A.F.Ca.US.006.01.1.1]RUZ77589.1 HAD family phosphatase [Mesorhizobium sp. M7A.F.Ca.US.006.01.1.1]
MKLIIFDCDGVLVNSEEIYQAAELEYLTAAGITFEPGAYTQAFMGLSPAMWQAKLEAIGQERAKPLSPRFFEQLADYTNERLRKDLAALPDARNVISRLPAPKCVASSTPLARLRWKLEHTGLVDLFDPHIFSSDMVVNGKPEPDLFLHAAGAMGVHARDCIVIEDSVNGVLAGKAAGMRVIGFTAGNHCAGTHGDGLLRHGADALVGAYEDLEVTLASL